LPPSLNLSTSGVISGTLTAQGSFTFTVLATDTQGCTGKRQYTVNVNCPDITVTPAKLSSGQVNHPYSKTVTASGGLGTYTFVVELGELPPGLTLSPEGLLTGTPTTDGGFNFAILATDSLGCTGKRLYSMTIYGCPPIVLKPFTLPNATIGQSYSKVIVASGSTGPYTFTALKGNLPIGLTLSTGGVLSGTLTTSGDFTFTVLASDPFGCVGQRQYTIYVR
jgi:hypothetical protein